MSSNAFVPYEGSTSLYIVGEIQNNTSENVEFAKISTVLRDSDGNVVGSEYTYADIDILTPGMKSPFFNIFFEPLPWSSYDSSVSYRTTTDQPHPIEIINHTAYFDSYSAFHVVGEVRNQYSDTRTYVQAFVTLYDSGGEVIGTDYSYTIKDELAPGETDTFHVEVYFWMGKPDQSRVVSYDLQVIDN